MKGDAMPDVMFIEIGTGVDLQGQDVTKAALRAVRDAIGRNYLPAMRRLVTAGRTMTVLVRLGVPPGAGEVDVEAVRTSLPHGTVTVDVTPGGMLVPNGLGDGGTICIVNSAIEVGVSD
jgi:uncharacterized protein (TIGR02058 family)